MTRETRRQANRDAAAWARDNGVTPSGQAWDAMRAGCRDVAALRSLNLADYGWPARTMPAGARSASTLRDGDILTGSGRVTGAPVADPDTGTLWVQVTRTDGSVSDLEPTPGTPVDYTRPRRAPQWLADAAADYRAARDAWEAMRESGAAVPTSVPGAAGSAASMGQLEPDDFALYVPRPSWAAFRSEYAARQRESA